MKKSFKALVVRQNGSKFTRSIEKKFIEDLPRNDVLIRVHYSSLNYKDSLSCFGDKTVTRHYPHTPGIDAAGIVEESSSDNFKIGDKVIVTSHDLGANTPGGFGQFIRVPENWILHLPKGLTLKESMAYGTAGYTAGLSTYLLKKNNILPKNGPILVTGSTGGVGSVAISILSNLGYEVFASTGKKDSKKFLQSIGAKNIISREDIIDNMNRTLLRESWGGVLDTVGGKTLEAAIKSCKKRGVIISCGMVSSPIFSITVFPFILRGISLIGTGASETTLEVKNKIWSHLAGDWKLKNFKIISKECTLNQIENELQKIFSGKQQGRIVVNMIN